MISKLSLSLIAIVLLVVSCHPPNYIIKYSCRGGKTVNALDGNLDSCFSEKEKRTLIKHYKFPYQTKYPRSVGKPQWIFSIRARTVSKDSCIGLFEYSFSPLDPARQKIYLFLKQGEEIIFFHEDEKINQRNLSFFLEENKDHFTQKELATISKEFVEGDYVIQNEKIFPFPSK